MCLRTALTSASTRDFYKRCTRPPLEDERARRLNWSPRSQSAQLLPQSQISEYGVLKPRKSVGEELEAQLSNVEQLNLYFTFENLCNFLLLSFMFRLATSSHGVCLGYWLINERIEIALRSNSFFDNYVIFKSGAGESTMMDFPGTRSKGSHKDEYFWFSWEQRGWKKRSKSSIISWLNSTSSGFCVGKSNYYISTNQMNTFAAACSDVVPPRKFPTQSLFANVWWQAKAFLLKREGCRICSV